DLRLQQTRAVSSTSFVRFQDSDRLILIAAFASCNYGPRFSTMRLQSMTCAMRFHPGGFWSWGGCDGSDLIFRIFFRTWPNEPPWLTAQCRSEIFRIPDRFAEVRPEGIERALQFLGGIAEVRERDRDIVVLGQLITQVFDMSERLREIAIWRGDLIQMLGKNFELPQSKGERRVLVGDLADVFDCALEVLQGRGDFGCHRLHNAK